MTGVGGGAMERKARRRTRGEMASMRSASVLRRAKAEAARSMGRNSALAKSGWKPKMMVPMRAANWRRTSGARRRERRGSIEEKYNKRSRVRNFGENQMCEKAGRSR